MDDYINVFDIIQVVAFDDYLPLVIDRVVGIS